MSRANGPGQSTRLLLDIVDVLNRERTNYAVIGAVAAAVHGVVRASLDADAVVSLSVGELTRWRTTLTPLGLRAELRRGDSDDPVPGMLETAVTCERLLVAAR